MFPLPPLRSMGVHRGKTFLPICTGVYSVGCTDLANPEVFLRLFYPHRRHHSQQEKKDYLMDQVDRWASWFPEPDYASAYLGFKYSREFPTFLGHMFIWLSGDPYSAVINNGQLDNGQAFPTIVFSHGNGGCRSTYSMLCSEIASHGYVVAAIEHSDGSASVGRKWNPDKKEMEWIRPRALDSEQDEYEFRNDQVTTRAKECNFALKLLENLHNGNISDIVQPFDLKKELDLSTFKGRFDLDKGCTLAGHSFGGGTVVKALGDYGDKFKAAFCFDSWLFPIRSEIEKLSETLEKDKKPIFFLNYEKFQWKKNLKDMSSFERSLGTNFPDENVATFNNTIHYSCTDLPTIFSGSYIKHVLSWLEWFSARNRDPHVEVMKPEQTLTLSQKLFKAFLDIVYPQKEEGKEKEFVDSFRDLDDFVTWGTHYKD